MKTDWTKYLDESSKLVFPNGEVIEGAQKVGDVILTACEVYNKAYRKAYRGVIMKAAGKGLVVGAVIVGVGYVAIKIRNQRFLEE